jgi:hypothetical protein
MKATTQEYNIFPQHAMFFLSEFCVSFLIKETIKKYNIFSKKYLPVPFYLSIASSKMN